MKIQIIYFVFIVTLCSVSCAQSENSPHFNLDRLDFLEEEVASEMQLFFSAIVEAKFGLAYEFGSEKFKKKIPKDWFTQRLSDWEPGAMDLLFLSQTDDSGFYLVLSYGKSTHNRNYTAQFWKIEDGRPRFLHFPFARTGIPETMLLTPLYEHN